MRFDNTRLSTFSAFAILAAEGSARQQAAPVRRNLMDTAHNITRKDTTKGPALRILSLDGGGVRGYSMLILLQELMHKTYVETEGRAPRYDQVPKPCEHFDLIAGTGTGGLIAIMLGRLRLDLETCKDVYVRMTRKVFVSDKRVVGIPYSDTLFKASELQEAIMECVREYTGSEKQGFDGAAPLPMRPQSLAGPSPNCPFSPASFDGLKSPADDRPRRTFTNSSSTAGMARVASMSGSSSGYRGRRNNPNALLYDARENRTKTAVTAVYQGSTREVPPALLRSYDSRKEPAPEANCTIWEAGRATCAIGLAFKPMRIGQSIFTDEGEGRFNPTPQIVDEALVNEWPGRQIGCIVSIGTGKRQGKPEDQHHQWWEGISSGMQDFADARRRLTFKIQGCETTHQYMLKDHLRIRGIRPECYVRLNVDEGVGDYGMNEWDRLPNVTTSTRSYLGKYEVKAAIGNAAARLGAIKRKRMENHMLSSTQEIDSTNVDRFGNSVPDPHYGAVELSSGRYDDDEMLPNGRPVPGPPPGLPPSLQSGPHRMDAGRPSFGDGSRPSSAPHSPPRPPGAGDYPPPPHSSHPLPAQNGQLPQPSSPSLPPRRSGEQYRPEPPPRPPKTPIPPPDDDSLIVSHPAPPMYTGPTRRSATPANSSQPRTNSDTRVERVRTPPPYPEDDGPPPIVPYATKPVGMSRRNGVGERRVS